MPLRVGSHYAPSMLGISLVATGLDGYQPGDPYQVSVTSPVQGCAATYPAGSYWFTDSPPIGYHWPWRPTLTLKGPLGRPIAGAVVHAQLSNHTSCMARQATTDQDGNATLEFPAPGSDGVGPYNPYGWNVLSAVAVRWGLEVARLGTSPTNPLPRISLQPQSLQPPNPASNFGFWDTVGYWLSRFL